MSSIEEERLRRFHRERIESAAKKLRARGMEFFPLGADATCDSYFEEPPTGPDFISLDESEVGPALKDLWRSQNLPELLDLVDDMMELARELSPEEAGTADISPFVYVMY